MCALFRNRYRIGSKRYPGYDYSSSGKYFITICTKNKIPYFGKIENGNMILSELGMHLQMEWLKTPICRPDMNISLDEFIIMPDHFHAIIIIGVNRYNKNNEPRDCSRHATHGVSTNTNNDFQNKFGSQSKNLSSIIRGVKSGVTTYAKEMKLDFAWQPRFHDHIIRTGIELKRIRNYISTNPQNWMHDPNNITKLI
jgi:putative transposase